MERIPRALVEAFEEAARALNRHMDNIYTERISPLVFFVGATGLQTFGHCVNVGVDARANVLQVDHERIETG